jgi:hypothetical protein
VEEYIEYCNLVGENGGVMMSEREFADYKKNYAQLAQNRMYTTWYNPDGVACKVVGPSSKCFCDHPYKTHDFLECPNDKIKCKQVNCKCANYSYLPIYGSQDFKCSCKHSYMAHDAKRTCTSCACKAFTSSWTCTCGYKYMEHKTVSERGKEKEEKGEVVNVKQGGVVSYSSMLDGVERFGHGIKEEMKAKGIKVQIEEFFIPEGPQKLGEEVSAW